MQKSHRGRRDRDLPIVPDYDSDGPRPSSKLRDKQTHQNGHTQRDNRQQSPEEPIGIDLDNSEGGADAEDETDDEDEEEGRYMWLDKVLRDQTCRTELRK